MNAAFQYAIECEPALDCIVFHDADMLPENDRNYYGCEYSPTHIGAFVDSLNYTYVYINAAVL